MGFVTHSQMRTDYKHIFQESIGDTQYNLVIWLTPNGVLIEIVKETMDSQSVNEEVILSKMIDKNFFKKGGV